MEQPSSTWSILWRGRFLILASTVMTIVATIVATHLSPKVYETSAIIQVESAIAASSADANGVQQASQSMATTYATLVNSRSFQARIRSHIQNGRYDVSYLQQNISGRAIKNGPDSTNLIEIGANAAKPSDARALANGMAKAFVTTIQGDAARQTTAETDELQARITTISQRISALTRAGGNTEDLKSLSLARAALTSQLASLIANRVSRGGSISIVASADLPSAPIKPRPVLNLMVGMLLGLLLGVGLAWGRSALDRNIESSDEIEELTHLPVLASIPLSRGRHAEGEFDAEAYQVLRTNLAFLSKGGDIKVITVTSHDAGEGKSSVAEGLARAAVRTGSRVLLIDGDTRTRRLSQRLGVEDRSGLSNLVATPSGGVRATARRGSGARTVTSASQREAAKVVSVQAIRAAIVPADGGLSVLPSGPTPPNPASMLANARLQRMLTDVRDEFDLVLIDSPPVGRLADASLLASSSDGSIIVARAGSTSRKDIRAALANLARTSVPCLGVVVFEPRTGNSAYYRPSEPERRA